jgi:hypothetical protein
MPPTLIPIQPKLIQRISTQLILPQLRAHSWGKGLELRGPGADCGGVPARVWAWAQAALGQRACSLENSEVRAVDALFPRSQRPFSLPLKSPIISVASCRYSVIVNVWHVSPNSQTPSSSPSIPRVSVIGECSRLVLSDKGQRPPGTKMSFTELQESDRLKNGLLSVGTKARSAILACRVAHRPL